MKPFLNLDEIEEFESSAHGDFQEKYAVIGKKIGAQKLSYSISIVPPGKKVCPFHNHRVNEEMFLILDGEGSLRFGDQTWPIKKHDIIACPPGDSKVAHQIINTGKTDIRYLCLSTEIPYDICEYPDSNKMLSFVDESTGHKLRHIARQADAVDYFEGEQ